MVTKLLLTVPAVLLSLILAFALFLPRCRTCPKLRTMPYDEQCNRR